jgi:hypothetical protein
MQLTIIGLIVWSDIELKWSDLGDGRGVRAGIVFMIAFGVAFLATCLIDDGLRLLRGWRGRNLVQGATLLKRNDRVNKRLL